MHAIAEATHWVLWVTTAVLSLSLTAPADADPPPRHTVICYPDGTCVTKVVNPGGGGSDGSGGGSGGDARCAWHGRTVPCTTSAGYFNASDGCYYREADAYPTTGPVAVEYRRAGGAIYWASCPFGGGLQSGGYVRLPNPPPGLGPTPAMLARQAFDSLTLTRPSTGRYPAGRLQDGTPYTVVRASTWYWTDPADFRTLTTRAAAGPVWARVTATPAALSFTPGDGNPAVSCAGPGTAWNDSHGVWAASPSGCDYRYPHSTIHAPGGVVTASYSIRWQVSWVGSGGTSGTLQAPATTSRSTFAVAEVESLVTR